MRAISQDAAGAPDVLKVVETQRPIPGWGEILVRVHAAGTNPTDWKTRERGMFANGATPPFTLGFDVAGVVEAVGAEVTLFQVGDEVLGMPRFPHPAAPMPSPSLPRPGTSPRAPKASLTSRPVPCRWPR